MTVFTNIATSAALISGLLVATPSTAVVTTFASFNATSTQAIAFKNNGTYVYPASANTAAKQAAFRAANNISNGNGGALFTTASANTVGADDATPGSVLVTFSYLNLAKAANIKNVSALFTLNATTTQKAMRAGTLDSQVIDTGSFSFKTTQAYTVNGINYAAGANLLSASILNDALVYGPRNSTSATFGAATSSGSTIVYTSDFLNFAKTANRDFSFSLSGIVSKLSSANKGLNFAGDTTSTLGDDHALRSFRGTTTGSFSSDPAPLLNAVPEPAIWSMMIGGFGLIGFSARRRRSFGHCVTA